MKKPKPLKMKDCFDGLQTVAWCSAIDENIHYENWVLSAKETERLMKWSKKAVRWLKWKERQT